MNKDFMPFIRSLFFEQRTEVRGCFFEKRTSPDPVCVKKTCRGRIICSMPP
jgi:hypothetical protein